LKEQRRSEFSSFNDQQGRVPALRRVIFTVVLSLVLAILLTPLIAPTSRAQTVRFRSGIFLHHSTGGCIWGPNGYSTSVPIQMALYNQSHAYSGDASVALTEQWYPGSTDNEWVTWHSIFEDDQPEPISGLYPANRIVMVKSCFPSSDMSGVGLPSDTTDAGSKTLCNYKWHWRHIVSVMRTHPQNFFIIWTNAPLERQSTNAASAHLSDLFCTWAKDTLATGLDPVISSFPPNVYVFDFFHKLTDSAGFMRDQYRTGPGDSHPNAAATDLVAPQLVTEMFDRAIAYELDYNESAAAPGPGTAIAGPPTLMAMPNPFSAGLTVRYAVGRVGPVRMRLYDPSGRVVRALLQEPLAPGRQQAQWDGRDEAGRPVPSGVYLCRLEAGRDRVTLPIVLLR